MAMEDFEPAVPFDRTFPALIGLEMGDPDPEEMTGTVPVGDHLKQPFGIVHGGVYASIAETLASVGTAAGVLPEGRQAMGLSNTTSFLRPLTEGTIHATARRFHRGRTTWLWDVEMRDDEGRLVAVTRMTIAVR
jgi:uncharacterized protein (TIGR00369 family)